MASKRISKEFAECSAAPPEGTTIELADSGDLHRWHVTIDGPAGTPYAGGKFGVVLVLPTDYPFKAPTVNFTTRIYHPNITNDNLGSVCLSILKSENWKPATKLRAVIESLQSLLALPLPDDPLETRIADEFRNNNAEYRSQATFYTEKYARKPPTFSAAT